MRKSKLFISLLVLMLTAIFIISNISYATSGLIVDNLIVNEADTTNTSNTEKITNEAKDVNEVVETEEIKEEVEEVVDETIEAPIVSEPVNQTNNTTNGITILDDHPTNQVPTEPPVEEYVPSIVYSTHVQNRGDLGESRDGEMSGTTGSSLRIEAFKIKLDNLSPEYFTSKVKYSAYVEGEGWQEEKENFLEAGTHGQSKRIEIIKIHLEGALSNDYDVYYRTHVAYIGWLDWAKNGEESGSVGYDYRIESIQIKLVKKTDTFEEATDKPLWKKLNLYGNVQVQNVGWSGEVKNPAQLGTVGRSLRIETLVLDTNARELGLNGNIEYNGYVEGMGWQGYKEAGEILGTVGKSKRLEAIQIRLTGDLASNYNVKYRVHVQNIGWMDWASNGEKTGTLAYDLRIEAIEIRLQETKTPIVHSENEEISSKMYRHKVRTVTSVQVQNIGWMNNVLGSTVAGTSGKSLRIETIKINLEKDDDILPGGIEYSAYVEGEGWQEYKTNGEAAGTVGKSKRMEAMKIRLTGKVAEKYDVYYRVHVQNAGWLGWAKNDAKSGTNNMGLRIEALQIMIAEKGNNGLETGQSPYLVNVIPKYASNVSTLGWQEEVKSGAVSGTTGKDLPIEQFKVSLDLGESDITGNVVYNAYIKDEGWMEHAVSNGAVAGEEGKIIEAIKIGINGEVANYYNIFYRVHVKGVGWLKWAENNQETGWINYGYQIEAMQIMLVRKGYVITNGTNTKNFSVKFEGTISNVKTNNGYYYKVPRDENIIITGNILNCSDPNARLRIRYDGKTLNNNVTYDKATGAFSYTIPTFDLEAKSDVVVRLDLISKYDDIISKYEYKVGIDRQYEAYLQVDRPGNMYIQRRNEDTILHMNGYALSNDKNQKLIIKLNGNYIAATGGASAPSFSITNALTVGGEITQDSLNITKKPAFSFNFDMRNFGLGVYTITFELQNRKGEVIKSIERKVYVVDQTQYGVDVSKHNGTINWDALVNKGVTYAIIRVGWYSTSRNAFVLDECFERNYNEAKARNIKVGVYTFSYAQNYEEGRKEAEETVKALGNKSLDLPIFIDVEDNKWTRNVGVEPLTDASVAFCDYAREKGYLSGVYASASWLNNKLNKDRLNNYVIWLASYTGDSSNGDHQIFYDFNSLPRYPSYSGRYSIWQYSSSGYLDGSTPFDLNLMVGNIQ
ncbi:MAG: hypothetical protein IKN74_03195 [Clostridia bacterium]|nr:hypothetical protein [Clostridia bacterium]